MKKMNECGFVYPLTLLLSLLFIFVVIEGAKIFQSSQRYLHEMTEHYEKEVKRELNKKVGMVE